MAKKRSKNAHPFIPYVHVWVERDVRIRLVFCCLMRSARARTFTINIYIYLSISITHLIRPSLYACASMAIVVHYHKRAVHTQTSMRRHEARSETKKTGRNWRGWSSGTLQQLTKHTYYMHKHSHAHPYDDTNTYGPTIGSALTMFHSARTISFAVRTWSGHIHVTCYVCSLSLCRQTERNFFFLFILFTDSIAECEKVKCDELPTIT